jgi:hypothetical protein
MLKKLNAEIKEGMVNNLKKVQNTDNNIFIGGF